MSFRPWVVHCSAGIGRKYYFANTIFLYVAQLIQTGTGSFIAADLGLRCFDEGVNVNLLTLVRKYLTSFFLVCYLMRDVVIENLREDRGHMVQHWEQVTSLFNLMKALLKICLQVAFVHQVLANYLYTSSKKTTHMEENMEEEIIVENESKEFNILRQATKYRDDVDRTTKYVDCLSNNKTWNST